MTNGPRITKIGRFIHIHRTSANELPQLVNILLDSMSIVGPGPLPIYKTVQLMGYQRHGLMVKPGLINLRSALGTSVLEVVDCVKRVTGREFTVEWAIRRSWWAAVKRQKILGWEPRCTDIDTIVTGPLGEWLLENGVIPCEDSGKKTRRFRIKLEDIINFLVQYIQ